MLITLSIALNSGFGVEHIAPIRRYMLSPCTYERTAIRFSQRNERKPPFSISQ